MTTVIIIAQSPAAEVRSRHILSPFTFLIIIILLQLPELKKRNTALYLDPVSARPDRGCGPDKYEWHRWVCGWQEPTACHITISLLMVSLHASEAISVFPPYQCRKSEADINAFSSRNAILCLRACFDICPAPGLADSAHRQAPSINQPLD